MRIEKRTMNWLPQKSLYHEAEAARLKRKEQAQEVMYRQRQIANAFGALTGYKAQGQVDLAIKVAYDRIISKKV
jgi:hypothetical protein